MLHCLLLPKCCCLWSLSIWGWLISEVRFLLSLKLAVLNLLFFLQILIFCRFFFHDVFVILLPCRGSIPQKHFNERGINPLCSQHQSSVCETSCISQRLSFNSWHSPPILDRKPYPEGQKGLKFLNFKLIPLRRSHSQHGILLEQHYIENIVLFCHCSRDVVRRSNCQCAWQGLTQFFWNQTRVISDAWDKTGSEMFLMATLVTIFRRKATNMSLHFRQGPNKEKCLFKKL